MTDFLVFSTNGVIPTNEFAPVELDDLWQGSPELDWVNIRPVMTGPALKRIKYKTPLYFGLFSGGKQIGDWSLLHPLNVQRGDTLRFGIMDLRMGLPRQPIKGESLESLVKKWKLF